MPVRCNSHIYRINRLFGTRLKNNTFSISAVADEAINLFEAKITNIKSKEIETPNQVYRQK
jgi:hypothetical protein